MKYSETQLAKLREALARASNPRSLVNIQMVFEAAFARGIDDAMPGENVLTFNAWRAKGRVVKKGEKALCKLPVVFTRDVRDPSNGEVQSRKMMATSAVFHISQTKPLDDAGSGIEAYISEGLGEI